MRLVSVGQAVAADFVRYSARLYPALGLSLNYIILGKLKNIV